MVQSRGERLSIWAPASAPFTDSEADARSAVRPTRTAESATGSVAGTRALLLGAIVRTMGGEATADGEATGLELTPGEGCCWTTAGVARARRRSVSLGLKVGGTPGGVGATVPGPAPRRGRSLAGAHDASASVNAARSRRRR